jgi:hypothetical protein
VTVDEAERATRVSGEGASSRGDGRMAGPTQEGEECVPERGEELRSPLGAD